MPSKIIRTLLAGTDAAESRWIRHCLKPAKSTGKPAGTQWRIIHSLTFDAAINYLGRGKTDVILIGLRSSGYNFYPRLQRLRQFAPQVPVIAVTDTGDEGVLHTACALMDATTIQRSAIAAVVLPGKPRADGGAIQMLTPRESQILRLIAEAWSTKEIAVKLNISDKTAETHRSNLMRKLKLHSVGELIHYAIRHGIVEV